MFWNSEVYELERGNRVIQLGCDILSRVWGITLYSNA